MTKKRSLNDLSVFCKKVLVRVDFNVPLDEQGKISDDTRIRAAQPTIQFILDQGGAVILMSHLGRPKGVQSEFSLKVCADRLGELLQRPILMAPDCIGAVVNTMATQLQAGQVLMLENLRFHQAEEKPESDPDFARQLASLGDIYVNDAFGTAHRTHSSTATISQYFPQCAVSGFLMEKEITFLGEAILHPRSPFYAIIGGKKISSKLGVIQSLLTKVDGLIIGGGMAYTFLKAKGMTIGNSICEDDLLQTALDIMQQCIERQIQLLLPVDIQAADHFSNEATVRLISLPREGIPEGYEGMDIGPETICLFTTALSSAATILWNGPLGVAELPRFARGTEAIAKVLASSNAVTIVGGGDSVAALQATGLADKISHLSTGGGASLEYIEFGTLPGIEALSDR